MGRHSSYKPEYARQARILTDLGAINTELAAFFNTTDRTILKWQKDFPDFAKAIEEGKALADARVEKALFHRAIGYKHTKEKVFQDGSKASYEESYPPDTTACIFWLKNRRRDLWRDKHDHEVSGKDGEPLQPTTDVELARRIAFILAEGEREVTH